MRIKDIHKKIMNAHHSTIYRNMEDLFSQGIVQKIVLDKKNIFFELCEKKKMHGHFICTVCKRVEEIPLSLEKMSFLLNYTITDAVIRGVCKECKK